MGDRRATGRRQDGRREGNGRMPKHGCESVKKHYDDLGSNGPVHKGNRNRKCKYCERMVVGTMSRAKKHFLENTCNPGRLRATLSKEELQERERGRNVAITELRGVGALADVSSGEDEWEATEGETPKAATRSTMGASCSKTEMRQSLITDSAAIVTKNEETQRSIDDWMTAHCIPFNMMKSEEWDNMVKALMNAHESFTYVKYEKARTTRVEARKGRVAARVEELRRQWPSTVCATAGRMIEAEFLHIFSIGCTAHNIDLMLEAFTKIGWVDDAIKREVEVAKLFTNHTWVRDLLLSKSNREIVAKPGATRFATNFIMLGSLQRLYLPLRSCLVDAAWKESIVLPIQRHLFHAATECILDNSSSSGVEKVIETSKPLLGLLKFVDGDGPTISKIYGRMDNLVEKLRENEVFTGMEKDELEAIIMRRWNAMTSPVHCAAMFLDPEFKASKSGQDLEVADGFWTWVYSWCKRPMYKAVDEEVNNWIDGVGKFRWNQHLLKKLTKKPKAGEDDLLWEEDLDLEKKEVTADAAMCVDEWRSHVRELNEGREDSDDDDAEEDDNDEDAVEEEEERERGTGQMVRTRIESDLLELETQLNESWWKSTKVSKYLARLHVGELQQAMKTMGDAHAEKYMASCPKASALPPKTVKCGPGRPRKVVEEAAAMEESGGGKETVEEGGATTKRPPGRPRKAVEETSATEESGRADDNAAEEEACDSDEQPLHCGTRRRHSNHEGVVGARAGVQQCF
ncbi:hypothetical protein CBR_g17969 [Chara braunii]|uniref:DUF659 domain-containing protein n=1 Tax=Chara braunii TaxID=69332 RepID=A0A388KW24_CHABU|nr:hypothetical protein CBR_g17969 [Chara braunii]|eukprot:GBG74259.1 hypothetical protein CBR_g17969 [Chara braunii]